MIDSDATVLFRRIFDGIEHALSKELKRKVQFCFIAVDDESGEPNAFVSWAGYPPELLKALNIALVELSDAKKNNVWMNRMKKFTDYSK